MHVRSLAAVLLASTACTKPSVDASNGPPPRPSSSESRSVDPPRGLFALTPVGASVPVALLEHPEVAGIVLRASWKDVEPRPEQIELAVLERELDRIAAAGKAATVVVSMGGLDTPEWLREQGIATVTLTDPQRFHTTYGQAIEIPLFWDERLLAAKRRLIAAMGARLGHRREVAIVSAQCANATTDDWNLLAEDEANVAAWLRAGFTTSVLQRACEDAVDATMAAFPSAFVRMAVGRVPVRLGGGPPDALVENLVASADRRHPGRLILQRHNLSARAPLPDDRALHGWKVLVEHRPRIAMQFLWPAVDTESCRLVGQTPCDARVAFRTTADVAIAYAPRYVEVYGADVLRPELADEVRRLARSLTGDGEPRAISSVGSPQPPRGDAQARPGPREGTHALEGTVERRTFVGPETGQEMTFSVYLPPGFEQATTRPPVIYWLHGKGGDHVRSTHVVRFLEQAMADGRIEPCIMVFPDARDTFYTDSPDASWPIETMILQELLPHVEAHYRPRPGRAGRLLMGFSMGGFGALKFAALHPERFAGVVAYGAPRTDVRGGMGGQDDAIFQSVFRGDIGQFERNTPAYLFTQHRSRVERSRLAVRLVAGSADGTRRSMALLHDVLERLGVPHEYEILDDVPHVVARYYEAEAGRGFAFLGRAASAATAAEP